MTDEYADMADNTFGRTQKDRRNHMSFKLEETTISKFTPSYAPVKQPVSIL